MQTKTTKTLFALGLRVISCLMILSMLLSSVWITPASAASTYTISGSAGVANVTITYDGGSTTTDSSGNYSITRNQWWIGTVTPSKLGYTFSPTNRNYFLLNSNQTNQTYTATALTYTISGSTGTAGAGASITYTGGSTIANGSTGNYSFTVAYGWSGTVTPTKSGYTFSPANRSYASVTANQTNQNYTATLDGYTISGNAGAASVVLTYSGGSVTANSAGDYSFAVASGWSGTVTPSKTGFSFTPASKTYTNLAANQTAQDYSARPTTFAFASIADGQGVSSSFASTANQVATLNPALVLFNGDLEDTGFALSEINPMVSALKSANLFNKTFLVRGNADDHVSGSAALWESYFETSPNIKVPPTYVTNKVSLNSTSDQLVYSFDYGNSIFIGLDVPGDIDYLTTAQLDFLDARLTYAEGQGLTHAFIFFHGPAYPVESVHSLCSARADANCTPPALMTIINNHPIVSATFHGHEHVLAWTHMDGTRVAGLTRSYEQFITSPSGGATYNEYLYPQRVDYSYADMENSQGFATISVDGLAFTYRIYKTGTTQAVYSHTFSKLNSAPTISDIADKTTAEDTASGAIPFTVGDAETTSAYLTVTASSSDTTLVPDGNISLAGSGANRTVSILPAPNQSGSATITVTVNDGNVNTSDSFQLTVNPVNDAPAADDQSVSTAWNTPINIVLTGTDVEASPLSYSIVADPAHGSLSGSGANQTYTPSANYSGTDSFTFKVNDGSADSLPATVSLNVTAYTISGNAGVAGATLSYTDGTTKTVTADSAGQYSFQVPLDWSGTVTPARAGYIFSPGSMAYANLLSDQSGQDYTTSGVTYTISGNAGHAGVTLRYTDGTSKTATADSTGQYSFEVSYNWSGMVTPSLAGYGFRPATRAYTNLTSNQVAQDYVTDTARTYYVDKTNPACTDSGTVGSMTVPFCTITRGAYLATAGQIVHVIHGTYAETVYPNSGTAGNPITFWGDPGVTVTGQPGTSTVAYSAFALGSKSYVVIDGFNIYNTSSKGIYADSSNHITITNNHVSYAGASSLFHPYEQGIYLKNTTYSTISGNTTDHNTCIGIRLLNDSNNNLVSNNLSFSNFSVVETDAAGIETTGSSYNTIINNVTYSNEDSGINIYVNSSSHVQSTYNLVIGNLSYENGDHGIDTNNSPYNTFVGNTVHGNGTTGINVEGEASTGSHHTTLVNNISAGNGFTPPSGSFGGNLRVDAASIANTTLDYDLLNRESATVQIIWNDINYTSLAALHAAVPTQEVHGLEGDPRFVAPVPSVLRQTGVAYVGAGIFGNYYPNVGSPAIDSANADATNEPLLDIQGNARLDDPGTVNTGAGVRAYDDRGAYEYLTAGASLPIVTTQAVTAITTTTATGNGNVSATGLPYPDQHGVVWSTSANPTTADSKTTDGPVSATGAFTSSMTGLTPGTLYHVRAYATNTEGTVYGDDVTFTALLVPAITTQAVTAISATTATGNGNVTALGIPNPTQHGVVWSTSANPTTADSKTTDGAVSAIGAFTSAITGLTPGTLYHARAYVTNAAATVYGEDVSFTTLIMPTVTTQAASFVMSTTAMGNGNITSLGIPNPTQHGFVWATTQNPTTANSKTTDGAVSATGAFTSTMAGLAQNTLYHARAYATNAAGTTYGEDVTFTTLLAPTVTTQAVTGITTTTASGNGNITVLGSSNPTEHGVVWATTANPTTANSKTTDGPVSVTGSFTSSITGLTPGALYHARAYATSDAGTSYGGDVTFTALLAPAVTTQAVTNIAATTATGNGNLTVLGVPNPTQHGVVWSTSANPTTADNKTTDGALSAAGAFTSSMTGLAPGMPYHVRAYATNTIATVYGADVTFTTLSASVSTTTPPTYNGTGSDVSGTGSVAWLLPGNITADDTNYAQVTLNSTNSISHYLEGTNYGFAIPANAIINGIVVSIGRYENGSGTGTDVNDSVVSLMKAGVVAGNNKAAAGVEWPTGAPVAATYGTTSDLWGTTWTPAEINAGNFGVALSVNSSNTRIAYVDYVQVTVTYTLIVSSSTTTVNCGAGSPVAIYGSNVTCVASVVRGAGSYTPTGNVTWTTGGSGSFVTSPCTLSGSAGTASCSVTYTPSLVGSGSHLITAAYAGDTNILSSTGNQTVTVNKKDASVTPNAVSKTYGDLDPALTGTLTGFLSADGVTAAYSRLAGNTVAGSPYAISAVLSSTGVLANYNITTNPAVFTINKKDASVTLNAASKTYGDIDPTLNGSLTGFLSADDVKATYSRVAGETVDGGPYAISAVLSPAGVLANYNIATGTAALTITQKTASVSPDAASKPLGAAEPTLTGTLTGFLPADNVTAAYSRTKGETIEGNPYTISAVLSPVNVLPNYAITINTANFNITVPTDEYTLTLTPVGKGEITATPNNQHYHYGDVVTLTATPDAGWSFKSWSDNAVGGTITMHGNTTVTATFTQDEYTLTIKKDGSGKVTVDKDASYYHFGDIVTLTAIPEPGWSLESWSNNVIAGTVTINANTTVTATFSEDEYTLTILKTGNGTVTKAPDQATYHYGDIITLTATPEPGWSFGSWSDNVIAGKVTINANTSVTAPFTQNEYALTVTTIGNGTVTKAPDQATYHKGDEVVLTTIPDEGWSFDNWSANVVAGKITINANTTVTATFTKDEYSLTINKIGNGTVTKAPDQATYHKGDEVTLTATPDADWTFGSWSSNLIDGKVTINGNTTITATFIAIVYDTKLTTSPVAGAYGDKISLSATLTKAGLESVAGKTIEFSLNGNPVGKADTNSSGVATLNAVSLDSINAGTYPTAVSASFAGDVNYTTSSDTDDLTVTKRAISVTADAKTKHIHEADPALTYQVTTGKLVGTDTFSGALVRKTGEALGTYPILQGTLALSSNYEFTYIGANLTITPPAKPIISGNAGVGRASLRYSGSSTPVIAADDGTYEITVPTNWSGSIVISKASYVFTPAKRSYSRVQTNRTGQNFVAKLVKPAIPTLISPTGVNANANPTFVWNASAEATSYRLSVYNPSKKIYVLSNVEVPATVCTGTPSVCSFQPEVTLDNFTFRFGVAAINAAGNSGFAPLAKWRIFSVSKVATYGSIAAQDGYLTETAEKSKVANQLDAVSEMIYVGDSDKNQQILSILSFDTADLPNNAVIVSATLKLKQQGEAGDNPFGANGALLIDIRGPYFGKSPLLQLDDFAAPAGLVKAGTIGNTPGDETYIANMTGTAAKKINKTGTTQLRLRFTNDDDNDAVADWLAFFSGDAPTEADRPVLEITYYIP